MSAKFTYLDRISAQPDIQNWSWYKKCVITAIWCLGGFVSTASGLGNALGYFVQAKVYQKDNPVSLSYSVSCWNQTLASPILSHQPGILTYRSRQVVAATAGIAIGPLVAIPVGRRFGRSFVFFWSMVGLLVTGIWSATMTHEDEYIPFVIARLFGGFFGGNATALGAETIMDLFFLHHRGKAMTVLNLSFLSGVVIGPTLSGFIVGSAPWSVQFWWTNGLELVIILLSVFLLEDTYYDREAGEKVRRQELSDGFIANRIATFFCGRRNLPPISLVMKVSFGS